MSLISYMLPTLLITWFDLQSSYKRDGFTGPDIETQDKAGNIRWREGVDQVF